MRWLWHKIRINSLHAGLVLLGEKAATRKHHIQVIPDKFPPCSFHISQAAFPCINLPFSCLLIKARLNFAMEKESRCWGKPQSRTARNSQKEKAPWFDMDLRTIFLEGREKENDPIFFFPAWKNSYSCLLFPNVGSMCWFVQYFQYFACDHLVVQHRKGKKTNADNLKINL